MKYYILEKDIRIHTPINLNNYKSTSNDRGGIYFIELSRNITIVDYIYKKKMFDIHHIVSDQIKEIFELYQDNMEFKAIFITDQKARMQYVYWELVSIPIECKLKEKNMILVPPSFMIEEKNHKSIFIIKSEKLTYVIVRFDVAETVMGTNPLGIKFLPVTIDSEE